MDRNKTTRRPWIGRPPARGIQNLPADHRPDGGEMGGVFFFITFSAHTGIQCFQPLFRGFIFCHLEAWQAPPPGSSARLERKTRNFQLDNIL